MLQPKRTKYRKQMKGRNRGLARRGNKINFGELRGEISMFKDLERGELDIKDFPGDDLNSISNKLFLIFYHLKTDKRKRVAENILEIKNTKQ